MQHRHQVALHVRQFALRDADLVAALARCDDSRRAFRVFVEPDQVCSQPPHRPHEQIMQREIDQQGGEGCDPKRHHQEIARKTIHRLPQRQFVDHGLDELPAAGCGPHHADGVVAGLQHGLEGIDDRRPHRQRPHVDVMVDRRRQIGAGEQAALLSHLDRHRAGADAFENLPRQRIRDHARGRCVQHQSCGTGRRDTVVEPVHAEIRDRRHVDHQPGDHDQGNGEQQQLARQAEPARRGLDPAAALESSAGRRLLPRSSS